MANRTVRVVAAVIERTFGTGQGAQKKYLITQRREEAVLPLLWEFPGGRVEENETDEQALHREVLGRVGVDVEVREKLAEKHHEYEKYEVHLTLYACVLEADREPKPLRVREVRWVASSEFSSYRFPPADQATMDRLLGGG
jgi:8-oxo-dGTP diphosphatase